jgi:hypothetical protein
MTIRRAGLPGGTFINKADQLERERMSRSARSTGSRLGWPLPKWQQTVQVSSTPSRRSFHTVLKSLSSEHLPILRPSGVCLPPALPVVNVLKKCLHLDSGLRHIQPKALNIVIDEAQGDMERKIYFTGERHDRYGNRRIFDHVRKRPCAAYTLPRVQPELSDRNHLQPLQFRSWHTIMNEDVRNLRRGTQA